MAKKSATKKSSKRQFSSRAKSISFALSIAILWTSLILFFSASPLGKETHYRIANSAEYIFRDYIGLSPTLHPSIKVFTFDDHTMSMVKRPDFNMTEWSAILQRIARFKPKAIIIHKIFSLMPDNEKSMQVAIDRIKKLGVPVTVGAFHAPAKIGSRDEFSLNRNIYNLNYLNKTKIRPRDYIELDYNAQPNTSKLDAPLFSQLPKQRTRVYGPQLNLQSAFTYIGHFVYSGLLQTSPLFQIDKQSVLPHAALFAADEYYIRKNQLIVNGKNIPIDSEGRVFLNLSSLKSYYERQKRIPTVFKKDFSLDKGDVVLILLNMYTGGTDFHATPFGYIPGGYFLTTLTNSIITKKWIKAGSLPQLYIVLAALIGLSVGLYASAFVFWTMLLGLIVFSVAVGLISFSYFGFMVPWLWFALTYTGVALVVFSEKTRYNEKRSLRLSTVEAEKKLLNAIVDKKRDIEKILSNISQGILTFDKHLKLSSQYSPFLEKILGAESLAGKNVMDLLFEPANLSQDNLTRIKSSLMCFESSQLMFDFNVHQLPVELEYGSPSNRRYLELSWDTILDQSKNIDKIMICVRDVTELKQLRQRIEVNKREIIIFTEILDYGIDQFNKFLQSVDGYLSLCMDHNKADQVDLLFRSLHTVKGNARIAKFVDIVDICHEAEHFYQDVKSGISQFDEYKSQGYLDDLDHAVKKYRDVFDRYLGKSLGNDNQLELNLREFANCLQGQFEGSEDDLSLPQVRSILDQTTKLFGEGGLTLVQVLGPLIQSIEGLCAELDKPKVDVVITGPGQIIAREKQALIADTMLHIMRNSIDHGIEDSRTRLKKHKPPTGLITVRSKDSDGKLRMEVFDDGAGLNLKELYQKGVESDLLPENPSDREIAELIFARGISTSKIVNEISGRGVGMDAVKSFIKGHGGDVTIAFTGYRDDYGFRSFKFIVTV